MVTPGGAPGTSISDTFEGSLNEVGQWAPNPEAPLLYGTGWAGTSQNQFAAHQQLQPAQQFGLGQPQQGLVSCSYPSYAFFSLGYQVCQPTPEVPAYPGYASWLHHHQQLPQGSGTSWIGWGATGTGVGATWPQGYYSNVPVVQAPLGRIPGQAVMTMDTSSIPAGLPGDELPRIAVNVRETADCSPVGETSQGCRAGSDWLARLNPPECSPWELPKSRNLDPVERNASLLRWKDWLRFLQHCATCSGTSTCPVGEACAAGKELWRHMLVCTDKECKVRSCGRTRAVWLHQSSCGSALCDLCGPMHDYQGERPLPVRPLSSLSLLNHSRDASAQESNGRASLAPSISVPAVSMNEDSLDERIPGLSDSPDPILEEPSSGLCYEDGDFQSPSNEPRGSDCVDENVHSPSYKSTANLEVSTDLKNTSNQAKKVEFVSNSCPTVSSDLSNKMWHTSALEQSVRADALANILDASNLCDATNRDSSVVKLCSRAVDFGQNKACSSQSNLALPDCLDTNKNLVHQEPNSGSAQTEDYKPDLVKAIGAQSCTIEKEQSPMITEAMRCRNRGIQAKLIEDEEVKVDGLIVPRNHDATTNTDKSWTTTNVNQGFGYVDQWASTPSMPKTPGDAMIIQSSGDTTASYTLAMKLDEAEVTTTCAHVASKLQQGVDSAPVLVSVEVQTDTHAPSSGTAKSLSKFDSRESKMGVSGTQTVRPSQQQLFPSDNAATSFGVAVNFQTSQDKSSGRRPNSPSGSRGDESSTPRALRLAVDRQISTAPKYTMLKGRVGSVQAILAKSSLDSLRDNVKVESTSHCAVLSNAAPGLKHLKQVKTSIGRERSTLQTQSALKRDIGSHQNLDARFFRRKAASLVHQSQVQKCLERQSARKGTELLRDARVKGSHSSLDCKNSRSPRVNQFQGTIKPRPTDVFKSVRRESPSKAKVDSGHNQYTGSSRASMGMDRAKTAVPSVREKVLKGSKRLNFELDAGTMSKRCKPNEKADVSRAAHAVNLLHGRGPGEHKKFVGLFASLKGLKHQKKPREGPRGQIGKPTPHSVVTKNQAKRADGASEMLRSVSALDSGTEKTRSPADSLVGAKVPQRSETICMPKVKSCKSARESPVQFKMLRNHSDGSNCQSAKEEWKGVTQGSYEQAPLSLCECFSRSELETHFRVVKDEMGESTKEKGSTRGRLGEETCVVCKHQSLKYSPKVKNFRMAEEPWVQCDGCQGWVHQICSLFNSRLNSKGVVYTCPSCQLDRLRNGANVQPTQRSMNMNAENLPASFLSDFLESRLQTAVSKECRARSKLFGEEAPQVNQLTVREVFSQDRVCRAGQQFRTAFKGKRAMKFPYRQRVIMLFQKIDGVDVMIFCMYTQEYGPQAPEPNRGWIYLAYVDSIKYFQPNQIAAHSDVPLRTLVYHEILLGYMQFAQHYGYHSMFIWACPPGGKDNDYIMNCHPPSQKIPTEVRLRRWYLDLLEQAKLEGLVTEHTNMSEVLQKKEGAFASALQIPYFDGDYWPEETEKLLEGIKSKSRTRVCASSKGNAGTTQNCWDKADQDLMSMLRASQSVSAWQNFLLARFKLRCSLCKAFLAEGPSWAYYPSTSYSPHSQRRSSHGYSFQNDGNFVICPNCHKSELCCKELQASKLPGFMSIHDFVEEIYKPANLRPIPSDREISCSFLETRDLFLRVCQWNHYEFDSLRKAKHSSLMVLYHLMNPQVPVLPATCQVCHDNLEEDSSWKCPTCLEVRFCENCYASGLRHVHTLELVRSTMKPANTCPQQPPSENDYCTTEKKETFSRGQVTGDAHKPSTPQQKTFELLVHAQDCTGDNCEIQRCARARDLLHHVQSECRVPDCHRCSRLFRFLREHGKVCKGQSCSLRCCLQNRQRMKRPASTITQDRPVKWCRTDK